MYITPKPMSPDTFSQYGYADAANLRALRRGYGHDIYPQYPAAYDVPRVIAGLGAFTHKGYTVDYYASSTKFDDKNLKRLYEGMRNADIEFQKNAAGALKAVSPVFDAIEFASMGKIRAGDVRKALRLKLPTWGVALVLEVAAGKRPLDEGFRAVMRQAAEDVAGAKSLFAVITGLSAAATAASAAAAATGVGAPLAAAAVALGTLAASTTGATALCAILEPIFRALASGKAPTKKQMQEMMDGAAKLAGQKVPSNAEIDKLVADLNKAARAPSKPPKLSPVEYDREFDGNLKRLQAVGLPIAKAKEIVRQQLGPRPSKDADTSPKPSEDFEVLPPPPENKQRADGPPAAQTGASKFPVIPVVAAVGLLGALLVIKKKRK